MGGKYEVRGAMSGLCPFWDGQFTNSLAHALLLLIRLSLKYRIVEFNIRKDRIVEFNIRKEPLDCADCHDDNCPLRIRENCEWS